MMLFKFDIATEANDYTEETEDQVYIRNENGLELFGGVKNDDHAEEGK